MWIRLPHFKSKWHKGPRLKSTRISWCWNAGTTSRYKRTPDSFSDGNVSVISSITHSQMTSFYSSFSYIKKKTDKDLIFNIPLKTTIWRFTNYFLCYIVEIKFFWIWYKPSHFLSHYFKFTYKPKHEKNMLYLLARDVILLYRLKLHNQLL